MVLSEAEQGSIQDGKAFLRDLGVSETENGLSILFDFVRKRLVGVSSAIGSSTEMISFDKFDKQATLTKLKPLETFDVAGLRQDVRQSVIRKMRESLAATQTRAEELQWAKKYHDMAVWLSSIMHGR